MLLSLGQYNFFQVKEVKTVRLLISWFGVQVTDGPPAKKSSRQVFLPGFFYGKWPFPYSWVVQRGTGVLKEGSEI